MTRSKRVIAEERAAEARRRSRVVLLVNERGLVLKRYPGLLAAVSDFGWLGLRYGEISAAIASRGFFLLDNRKMFCKEFSEGDGPKPKGG